MPFPLHNKPLGLINKRIDNNKFNNNINSNNNIVHNLTKFNYNKKSNDLLEKIMQKVTKEKIGTNNIRINNPDKNNKLMKSSNDINPDENVFDNKIEENSDKNESNEDEDILLEQKDLMDEDGPNMININKVDSIQVHSNFIREHNYNTNKINKSSLNLKCNTEPNNANLYMNDLPSGRSNNSGNGVFFVPPEKKNKNWEGPYHHIYPPISTNVGYPYKGSFLSTNTNSHNQSGHKIDSSLSSESGQSPHYLSNIQSLQYNHTMNNFRSNNFFFPFAGDVTPIDNRHIYTSNIKSNENLFTQRQPFSLNINSYKTKTEYNNKFSRNNFGFKVEKQIINLENVALGIETRTTVMIRNIPIKYSTIELEEELTFIKLKQAKLIDNSHELDNELKEDLERENEIRRHYYMDTAKTIILWDIFKYYLTTSENRRNNYSGPFPNLRPSLDSNQIKVFETEFPKDIVNLLQDNGENIDCIDNMKETVQYKLELENKRKKLHLKSKHAACGAVALNNKSSLSLKRSAELLYVKQEEATKTKADLERIEKPTSKKAKKFLELLNK